MSLLKDKLGRFHHLDDEGISRLIAGEAHPLLAFRARRHLEKCWQCRSRKESLERAAMRLVECRNHLVQQIPSNPQRRAAFIASLRERSAKYSESPAPRPVLSVSVHPRIPMTPFLASATIVIAAVFLLVWVWQRPAVTVSAAQLLQRAELSDQAAENGKPGVIYRKIHITAPHFSIDRELYRDAEGRRKRRAEIAGNNSEAVQQALSSAGVDWHAPLSAESYRIWHDRQNAKTDKVLPETGGLLTLVTRISNGDVSEESITVRATDFHPVHRTIQISSYGIVEIAELNYAVLGWNGVNEALFEPLTVPHSAVPALHIALPSLPTEPELDSAELGARAVLNRLHADEGEQITVTRTEQDIDVKGIVDSDPRKREIVDGLRMVPHVKTEIVSTAEAQAKFWPAPSAQPSTVHAIDPAASPLETYLDAQSHWDPSLYSDAPQALLDATNLLRENSDGLNVIVSRFARAGAAPVQAKAVEELTHNHMERMLQALDKEKSVLERLGIGQPTDVPIPRAGVDLTAEVQRNNSLCLELVGSSDGHAKSASIIAAEIEESIDRLRAAITARGDPSTKEKVISPNPE